MLLVLLESSWQVPTLDHENMVHISVCWTSTNRLENGQTNWTPFIKTRKVHVMAILNGLCKIVTHPRIFTHMPTGKFSSLFFVHFKILTSAYSNLMTVMATRLVQTFLVDSAVPAKSVSMEMGQTVWMYTNALRGDTTVLPWQRVSITMEVFNVSVWMVTLEMEQFATMLTNVLSEHTAVIKMHNAKTLRDHFNVRVWPVLPVMAHTVRTLTSAQLADMTAVQMQPAPTQLVTSHVYVNKAFQEMDGFATM